MSDILIKYDADITGLKLRLQEIEGKLDKLPAAAKKGAEKIRNEFEEADSKIKAVNGSITELNSKLEELKEQRKNVAINTAEFKKLSEEIQNTRTEILKAEGRVNEFGKRTVNTTRESIDAFFRIGAAISAAYGIAKLVTFGKTQEQITKDQEKAQKAIAAALGLVAIAEGVVAAKRVISTIATKAATIATRIFGTALAVSTGGLTLIIGGIVAATAAFFAFSRVSDENTEVTKENTEAIKKQKEEVDALKRSRDNLKTDLLVETGIISQAEADKTKVRRDASAQREIIEAEAREATLKAGENLRLEIRRTENINVQEGNTEYKQAIDKRIEVLNKQLSEQYDKINKPFNERLVALTEETNGKIALIDAKEANRKNEEAKKEAKRREEEAKAAQPVAILRKQLEELRAELTDTTKSHEEYLAVLLKIEKKEDDIAIATGLRRKGEKEENIVFNASTKSKLEGFKAAGKAMEAFFDKYFENRGKEKEEAKESDEDRKESAAIQIEADEMIAEAKMKLTDTILNATHETLSGLKTLFEEGSNAAKAFFVFEKLLAIVEVIIQLQRELSAIASNPTLSLLPDGGLIAKGILAAKAKTGAGIRIATIAATAVPEISKFAEGVVDLQGAGTPTSDSIPAMLSRNESVITAKATQRYKEELIAANNMKLEDLIIKKHVRPRLMETESFYQDMIQKIMVKNNFDDTLINHNLKSIRKGIPITNINKLAEAISRSDRESAFLKRHRWDA